MTNLSGNQVVSISSSSIPGINTSPTPKKQSWLPLLTVLFLVSYGLMTMLIVEQGRTIESQRSLIRELFRDSQELSAVKKAQQESTQPPAVQTQAPVSNNRTQSPSSQAPSTQVPTRKAPSSQAGSQAAPQRGSQKPQVRMPSKQASDLIDDVRSLIAI